MKLLLGLAALAVVRLAEAVPVKSVTSDPTCVNNQSQGTTYVGTDGGVYNIQCSTDYYGGDLISKQASTFADCINACDANSACIDVSYVPASQFCYLKSSIQALVQNSGVWTARKAATTPSTPAITCNGNLGDGTFYTSGTVVFQVKCATDYYGGDLAVSQTATFELCMDACAANKQCVDVSYVGPFCYLKSSLGSSQSNAKVMTGLVVVGKSSTPPAATPTLPNSPTCANGASNNSVYISQTGKQYDIHCNTDYSGGDIASHQVASFADCIDFCDAASGCTDVQYAAPWCYVKGQLGVASSKSGVWSAVAKTKVVVPVGQSSTSTSSTRVAASSTTATSTCTTVTATNTHSTTIYNPSVIVSTLVYTISSTIYGTVTQTAPLSVALLTIQKPGTTTIYSTSTVYATVTATAYSTKYQKRSGLTPRQGTGCTVTTTVDVTSTAISGAQTASTTLFSTSYVSSTTTQIFEIDATQYTTPISTLSTTVSSVSTIVSVLVTYSTATVTLNSIVTSTTSTSSVQTCQATSPVLNSGFETYVGNSATGWILFNGGSDTQVQDVGSSVTAPHTGARSYALTQPVVANGRPSYDSFAQNVIFCPGLTYNWSAWFKVLDTSNTITVTFGIVNTGPRFMSKTGDWTLITGSFVATAASQYVVADMYIPTTTVAQTVYWDDIVVTLAR